MSGYLEQLIALLDANKASFIDRHAPMADGTKVIALRGNPFEAAASVSC